jgi:hypothetical protein
MITDHDIMELYRCLLGRHPENTQVINAFRDFYPNLELGRKALLESKEFRGVFERATGHKMLDSAPIAGELAFDLLARVGANAAPPPPQVKPDEAVSTALRTIFRKMGSSLFAVVVGPAESAALEGLVPLGRPESAVLHVAPGFPPAVPLVSRLADGTALFRLASDAEGLAAFLKKTGRHVDVLVLLGKPADTGWVDALASQFVAQALLVIGATHDGFDGAALSAAIAATHPGEQSLAFRGVHLHHFGAWLLPVMYKEPTSAPPLPDLVAYPSLAIATIVRNEAVSIENMLRSAVPLAKFFAVLDTGSTDNTLALARAYLDSTSVPCAIVQKLREDFDHDFSAMRNAALDMVPKSIDWVLMLDADEEIVPEDYSAFLELIASAKADAFMIPRYNFVGPDKRGGVESYPDWQIRLIRNKKKQPVRYDGRVHEWVRNTPAEKVPLDAASIGGSRGGPHIHHLVRRFRSKEEEKIKQDYYLQIAEKAK